MDACIVYASKNEHPRNSSRKAIVPVEQIVIPKKARDRFNTKLGDKLLVPRAIDGGIGIVKIKRMKEFAQKIR